MFGHALCNLPRDPRRREWWTDCNRTFTPFMRGYGDGVDGARTGIWL
jgi:hypothetical protein